MGFETEILVLNQKEIEKIVSLGNAIREVEDAFSEFAEERVVLPPAIGFPIDQYSGEMHIKSGYMLKPDIVAVKIASSFKKNSEKGLPTVLATILAFDSKTGQVRAIMDGSYITAIRTAAAGAVAAKYLSKNNSETIGIIGCGTQARLQLEAIMKIRKIKKVKVYCRSNASLEKYAKEMNKKFNIEIKTAESAEEVCKNVDILITTTPSHEPIVKAEWISKGTHINAIGSDNPKKQELETAVLKKADKIVADRIEQCIKAGEIHHAIERNVMCEKEIYAELGEITSKKKKGRESDKEITIFDSTGVAIQDISVAAFVLKKAIRLNVGLRVKI